MGIITDHIVLVAHGIGAGITVRFTVHLTIRFTARIGALITAHFIVLGATTLGSTADSMTHGITVDTGADIMEATGDGTTHGTITTIIADGTTRHTTSSQEVRANRDTTTDQTTDGMVCAPKPAAALLIQAQ